MAGVGSVGSSSIDINSIVSQLMLVESRRKTLLQKDEASYQVKLTTAGTLSSALSAFKSAMDSLRNTSSFRAVSATSGDSTVLAASASSTAVPGTHNIEVTQLAKANMLASAAHVDTSTAIATGTLTIKVGTGSAVDVTIDSSNNTLAGIRDAINKASTDVNASIINDGTGYKLIMTAKNMGSSNTIKVTVSGDSVGTNTDASGLSSLYYDPAGTKNMTEIQTAQSATFKIGTLTITKDSNTVSDVIPGVTLNLLKSQAGTPVSVTVANDTAAVSANVSKFVSEYNTLFKVVDDLTSYNSATKKAGLMMGDSTMMSIRSQIRNTVSGAIPGLSGAITSLSEIGVTTQSDGTLKLNSAKLSTVLSTNYSDVVKLFSKIGSATDTNITFASSTTATTAGTYAINVTQAASRGNHVGGAAVGSLTITGGSNDTLNLSINGSAGTITISAATYASGAALAAEIQSKINGLSAFSSAGITAAVSYDSGTGKLTITSDAYGSTSTVGSISGNAAANLGLDTGTGTAGVNVAGTIGGHGATGTGRRLTGVSGSPVEGLAINVLGTATGSRGTLAYSIGAAESLYNSTNTWLDSSNGVIQTKTDSINANIKRIQSQVKEEDARLTRIETTYRLKFTALQQTLDRLQGVSSFLSNQTSGLEKLIKG